MVLVHGYGGGACIFYQILSDLANYFHIYAIDLLGMGASARPEFGDLTVDETEDFFVNSIKKWKEKVGIQEKYYLAGHSMGGYISTCYAMRY